jgi:hypothetical protein
MGWQTQSTVLGSLHDLNGVMQALGRGSSELAALAIT